jgi:hypothetical protein
MAVKIATATANPPMVSEDQGKRSPGTKPNSNCAIPEVCRLHSSLTQIHRGILAISTSRRLIPELNQIPFPWPLGIWSTDSSETHRPSPAPMSLKNGTVVLYKERFCVWELFEGQTKFLSQDSRRTLRDLAHEQSQKEDSLLCGIDRN